MINQNFLNQFFPQKKKRISYRLVYEVIYDFDKDDSTYREFGSLNLDRPISSEEIRESLDIARNINEVFFLYIEKTIENDLGANICSFKLESDGFLFGLNGAYLPKYIIKRVQPIIDQVKDHPKLNSLKNLNLYPVDNKKSFDEGGK